MLDGNGQKYIKVKDYISNRVSEVTSNLPFLNNKKLENGTTNFKDTNEKGKIHFLKFYNQKT